jgi:hypothetical protein
MVKTRWRDKDSSATKRREALRKEENKQARRDSTQVKYSFFQSYNCPLFSFDTQNIECAFTRMFPMGLTKMGPCSSHRIVNIPQAEFLTTATPANARQAVLHRISDTHQEIIFVQPVTGKYVAASKASVRAPLLKKGGNPFALLSAMSGTKRKPEEAESAVPASAEAASGQVEAAAGSSVGDSVNVAAAEDGKKRRKRSKQRSGAATIADAE